VLVGTHGAGITNLVFMPPGGLVVEVVAGFDGRMLPLCGYHGPLAAVFGVHHYVFYYDWKLNAQTRKALDKATGRRAVAVDADAIAQEAKTFFREIRDKRRSATRT
jgi:capsular polysaccharide biosynthesis protein